MTLESKIEAILFFKGEPVSRQRLVEILKISKEEIVQAIENLQKELEHRGIVLQEKGDELTLGTAPEMSKIIENLQKEELNKNLSRASLETLSIILYKNGANRAEIDYIRGVNSSFILRALSVRGLVDRIVDPKDSRRFIYQPSFNLLSFMGIKAVEELSEYNEIKNSIETTAKDLENLASTEE